MIFQYICISMKGIKWFSHPKKKIPRINECENHGNTILLQPNILSLMIFSKFLLILSVIYNHSFHPWSNNMQWIHSKWSISYSIYTYASTLLHEKILQYKTRGPQALTVTWVSETLHWLLVKRAHICISTAPS